MEKDCLFCKIAQGTIPAKIAYEDEHYLAFHDIAPKAPVHLLLIPKQHIENLYDITPNNQSIVQNMILLAPIIAKQHQLESGFRLITNTGAGGGQEVNHIHFHLLGAVHQASWQGFTNA